MFPQYHDRVYKTVLLRVMKDKQNSDIIVDKENSNWFMKKLFIAIIVKNICIEFLQLHFQVVWTFEIHLNNDTL